MARDENFPVAFLLAPRAVRADMAAIYRFCRATDDLGDEGPGDPADRLEALDAWEAGLLAAVEGRDAPGPLSGAAAVIARRRLPLDPFLRLIEANRIDQRRARWDTHAELLEYCRHSATPVGEMVLGVLGHRDAWRIGLSDATCAGLQLVNFWQDIARDLRDRDRIYLPQEAMERFGVVEDDLRRPVASPAVRALVAEQVGLARALLIAGEPLYRLVRRRVALDVRMFSIGGLALCDAIARQDHDTLARRPAPGARRPGPHRRDRDPPARGRPAMTNEEAYAFCRAVARAQARNFYYGFVLLPPERRAGIYAAYAFSRRADDSVDEGGSTERRVAAVAGLRRDLDACVAGTAPADDPVLVALSDAIRRFSIRAAISTR